MQTPYDHLVDSASSLADEELEALISDLQVMLHERQPPQTDRSILEIIRSGADLYTSLACAITGGGTCSSEERALTKTVFLGLLYGKSLEAVASDVAVQLEIDDTSLVQSRCSALKSRHPGLGSCSLLTRFALVMELRGIKSDIEQRLEQLYTAEV